MAEISALSFQSIIWPIELHESCVAYRMKFVSASPIWEISVGHYLRHSNCWIAYFSAMIPTGELSELLATLYAASLQPEKRQAFFDRREDLTNISSCYTSALLFPGGAPSLP